MSVRRGKQERRGSDLARAVIGALAGVSAVGVSVLYLTGEPWAHDWRWGWQEQPWEKRITYAGALVTALGALIALVVSFRKQQSLEDAQFTSQFAAAAAQLGDPSAAVRIAGAYAMAALADNNGDRRQQCVDALCAYMRLAYDPAYGGGRTVTRTVECVDAAGIKSTTTETYRESDREVRLTIVSIIRDHLRDPKSRTTWCGYDLNFCGVIFDGGSFVAAHFTGGDIQFSGAKFVSDRVSFFRAVFSGGTVYFHKAQFLGGHVSFDDAEIRGSEIKFERTMFAKGGATFHGTKFVTGRVSIENAGFSGGWVKRGDMDFRGWGGDNHS